MKRLLIKKEDLKHNIDIIKDIAKKNISDENKNPIKIIAVLKANAYGLGLVQFANFLLDNNINFFAVANLEEALELRKSGFKNDILMLSSTSIKEEVTKLIENDIIITLGSKEAFEVADKVACEKDIIIKAHLKIDTGFGRYGFLYNNPSEIIDVINSSSNIQIQGTFSHFSSSFSSNSQYTDIQFKRFTSCVDYLNDNKIDTGMLHICNSCAFLQYPKYHMNAVRLGSAFLGRIPIKNIYGLKKIGQFETQVSEIKYLPKGHNIGYGNRYETKDKMKIAIIPVGYMDGFNVKTKDISFKFIESLRYLYNDFKRFIKKEKTYVTINGKNYKIVGVTGMYNTQIDITNSNVKVGDIVKIDISIRNINPTIERKYE